jgi:hypothetical protein
MPKTLLDQDQKPISDIESSSISLLNVSLIINPISLEVIEVKVTKEIRRERK